jgi:uncharacterized protein (TIGR02145 family)
MKKTLFIFLMFLFILQTGFSQTKTRSYTKQTGEFTDTRDNQTYKTVTYIDSPSYDTITIMAENLNFKMDGSYAYENNEQNREVYGLLYTWEAATNACPAGWHLPSDKEWSKLIKYLGGKKIAGEGMKSTSGWINDGNGTGSTEFNALPSGYRYFDKGSFYGIGKDGNWWSATESVSDRAWYIYLNYGNNEVNKSSNDRKDAFSCRCIKD